MSHYEIFQSIERLVHQTWWNTDIDAGAGGERFFCEDATIVMPARTMQGHAEIVMGSKARLARGPRLSRHLVQNLLVDAGAPAQAVARYVLLLYAKDGVAPMYVPSYSAMADVRDECILHDGQWLIKKRELSAVFLSPDNDSVMLVRSPAPPPGPTGSVE